MFEARLRLMLMAVGLAMLVIVTRLVQIQVVQASTYRERAEQALLLQEEQLPFIRGSIRERRGEVLVSDRASWDVGMNFAAIALSQGGESRYITRQLKRWYPEEARALRRASKSRWPGTDQSSVRSAYVSSGLHDRFMLDFERLPPLLATFEDFDAASLDVVLSSIYRRVKQMRSYLAERRGYDTPVREERISHTILGGLTTNERIFVRDELTAFPFITMQDAAQRVFGADTAPFAHVLGRTSRATKENTAFDPDADDELRRYLPSDVVGISGVEYAGESVLRGRRGTIRMSRQNEIVELQEPVHGLDLSLTIDGELQRRLYDVLARGVDQAPVRAGGALVVVHVPTREVLALVSYPSYEPLLYGEIFEELRDDVRMLPLKFKPVAVGYNPGSTVKPLVCLEGLRSGVITRSSTIHCDGYLYESQRNAWRCWQVQGTDQRRAHGDVNVVDSLMGSCNIFMYELGDRLGLDRLNSAFYSFGVGLSPGMGLREESSGINPTLSYMASIGRPYYEGMPMLLAIGQGELSLTPAQVANVMATYASGVFGPLRLFDAAPGGDTWELPVSRDDLRAIQSGMYQVVNDRGGTAHKTAYLAMDGWAICGKTGSATAEPRAVAYRVPFMFLDESGNPDPYSLEEQIVPAVSSREACDQIRFEHGAVEIDRASVRIEERWPGARAPDGGKHAHAWFGGFVQPLGLDGRPDWSRPSPIAFAVLVEYGGSGGRVSGPVARELVQTLFAVYGSDLSIPALAEAG